jgi:hypothetical protein
MGPKIAAPIRNQRALGSIITHLGRIPKGREGVFPRRSQRLERDLGSNHLLATDCRRSSGVAQWSSPAGSRRWASRPTPKSITSPCGELQLVPARNSRMTPPRYGGIARGLLSQTSARGSPGRTSHTPVRTPTAPPTCVRMRRDAPSGRPPSASCTTLKRRKPRQGRGFRLRRCPVEDLEAEEVGFEPTEPETGSPVFETGPFDHSGTPPGLSLRPAYSTMTGRLSRKNRLSNSPQGSARTPRVIDAL